MSDGNNIIVILLKICAKIMSGYRTVGVRLLAESLGP